MATADLPFGIDFGGTGIKAAPVDLAAGDFAAERVRAPTPHPATPRSVAGVMATLLAQLDGAGPDSAIGVTVPGIVRDGVVHSAANIDDAWIGADADAVLSDVLGRPVHALNDADAAGLAEARYGAARGQRGLVIVTTLGTGIGSAFVHDGVLVPNAELGHLEVDGGRHAERWASNVVREREELTWKKWAKRLSVYYATLERLFSPTLFVIGGGVSKHADEFVPFIEIDTPLVPATLRNRAGIVGAAVAAHELAARASA